MFTGIVEEVGHIGRIDVLEHEALRLAITAAKTLTDTEPGDSIAVNGVCLTVVQLRGTGFEADVMPETVLRTTLGALAPGTAVNLERAVTPTTRLGGHIVQGHVDGVGRIRSRRTAGDFEEVVVSVPGDLAHLLAEKGSVTLDGVSLTVVGVGADDDGDWFSVALIPTTSTHTTLGQLEPGAPVNLEVDVIAKYVERILSAAGR